MKKKFFLCLYYGFARYLPSSHGNILGKMGGGLRNLCARNLFAYCHPTANIEHMAYFGSGRGIEIGRRSGIGKHCRVPNNIKIGDNVMMGPRCWILDTDTHRHDRIDIPMIDQGKFNSGKRTEIGDDVWIGRECLIIGGKKVGSHTIIGARSVVSKDVPDYVIAAGNPIRVVKDRK